MQMINVPSQQKLHCFIEKILLNGKSNKKQTKFKNKKILIKEKMKIKIKILRSQKLKEQMVLKLTGMEKQ